ncbi:MAG: polyprenyl synthetase family protein [Planctomycetota bacterium]
MRGVIDIPDHLAGVQELIGEGLVGVERAFDAQLDSDLPPVDDLCEHIERYRGKMLRPMLVLLCGAAARDGLAELLEARSFDAVATPAHARAGAVCEMVHMATLVHDDVLDEADVRRRGQTVNALRGNELAVILGDYLIASAYELCSRFDSPVPARVIGRASSVMCTGELLQLHSRENASLDERTYFEILERKTGALIGAACELGVLCTLGFGSLEDERTLACRTYGRRLGVAFQIQDDLLDLTGDEAVVGKSVRKDIEKGKLTYPLIHHLANADAPLRGRTLRMVEQPGRQDADGDIAAALAVTGSIEASHAVARRLVDDAKKALGAIPEGPGRDMLHLMADAVVDRSH